MSFIFIGTILISALIVFALFFIGSGPLKPNRNTLLYFGCTFIIWAAFIIGFYSNLSAQLGEILWHGSWISLILIGLTIAFLEWKRSIFYSLLIVIIDLINLMFYGFSFLIGKM